MQKYVTWSISMKQKLLFRGELCSYAFDVPERVKGWFLTGNFDLQSLFESHEAEFLQKWESMVQWELLKI